MGALLGSALALQAATPAVGTTFVEFSRVLCGGGANSHSASYQNLASLGQGQPLDAMRGGLPLLVNRPGFIATLNSISATAPLDVAPGAFRVLGHPGGPFAPTNRAYWVRNLGSSAIPWTVTASEAWIGVAPAGGTLAAGAVTSVAAWVSDALLTFPTGVHTGQLVFANLENATTEPRAVEVTVAESATVTITPLSLAVTKAPGGVAERLLSVSNGVDAELALAATFTVPPQSTWLSVVPNAIAALPPGEGTNVTVRFDSTGRTPGVYPSEVIMWANDIFAPRTRVAAALTVIPDALSVTPTSGLHIVGHVGGPYASTSGWYRVANTGAAPVVWSLQSSAPWLVGGPLGGTLAAGTATNVELRLGPEVDAYDEGLWSGALRFSNVTQQGEQTRPASLRLVSSPDITVLPATVRVDVIAGRVRTQDLVVSNAWWAEAALAATTQVQYAGSPTGWLRVLPPPVADVAPGAGQTVTVEVDSRGLALGTHHANLLFMSNDELKPVVTAAVTLVYTANPLLVAPASVFTGEGGAGGPFVPGNRIYELRNTAGVPIQWSAAASAGWCDAFPNAGTLAPGGTEHIQAYWTGLASALLPGSHFGTVVVRNVTQEGDLALPVQLDVITTPRVRVTPGSIGKHKQAIQPMQVDLIVSNAYWAGGPLNFTATATETAREVFGPDSGPHPWLSVVPAGTNGLMPGAAFRLRVILDDGSLPPGVFDGYLAITSNDPQAPKITLPAHMENGVHRGLFILVR